MIVLINWHIQYIKRGDIMNDLVNLIINSSTSVVIIAYFIFRDYKWNNKLVESLTKIETLLDEINTKKGGK